MVKVNIKEVLRRSRDPDFNPQKFKQVLHYFINKTSSSDNVGKKAMYKLLYFNDFNFYELHEKKFTGEVYAKLDHGPAPRHFDDAIKELKDEGKIIEKKVPYFNRTQIKFFSIKSPDLSHFSSEQLAHLEDTFCRYGKMNGKQIEAQSHKDTPWEIAGDKKNLDYEMVFYRSPDMSVREYPDD